MKNKLWMIVTSLVVIAMLAACAAPTPVIVEKEVAVTVEKQVPVEIVKEVVVTPVPAAKPYEGVEVNILTFTGPQRSPSRSSGVVLTSPS